MATRPPASVRGWLAEFLLSRGHVGPTEKPLYTYQVTAEEFRGLQDLLFACRDHFGHALFGETWAAGFCLFVAERYRREYGADGKGWTWGGFERGIGCDFDQQQRAHLVERGLRYWKRPVRRLEGQRVLLGSLCLEGGLPWLLVQSETHGFGRAVRRGLKYFYRTEGGRRTTADLIGDSEADLPLTFRNLDTRQLLAGIVEQLMYLVRTYPLKDQPDPASYLDTNAVGWRSDFPLPLDESNARSLINDWLRDAGERNQEQREALQREREAFCEHRLVGEFTDWRIETKVMIPPEETLCIEQGALGGTRLSLGFYEGERLLANAGVVYGQLAGSTLKVRYPTVSFTLKRRTVSEPISLRLLESGRAVHVVHLEGSALELDELPLVFEARESDRYLVGIASCSLPLGCVWVRLPPGGEVTSGITRPLATERNGARWVESSEDLSIRNGDEIYTLRLKREARPADIPSITGRLALYESVPSTVFLGWPKIKLHQAASYALDQLICFANGRRATSNSDRKRAGMIRFSLRSRDGQTLLQRRIGVLPEGFGLSLLPATQNQPAKIIAKNAKHLEFRVKEEGLQIVREPAEAEAVILLHFAGQDPPAHFALEINSPDEPEPVTLLLNYPHRGARLIDNDNKPTSASELLLDELIGKRIALTTSLPAGELFHLQLDLINRDRLKIRQHYSVRVAGAPVVINLFGYRGDLQQMLGSVDDQDAYVRLTVETDHRLLLINVRRYNGELRKESATTVAILDMNGHQPSREAALEAMFIAAPDRAPLSIPEKTTQGVGTGEFEIPNAMESEGPWLLYPSKRSGVRFRPYLYLPKGFELQTGVEVLSLHQATQMFHPDRNPRVISDQLLAMTTNLDHSGWQYLDHLRRNFGHLPLSTFESWLALASHGDCLAIALLQMQVDEAFCNRIRDELAVTWECIPVATWVGAFGRFRQWLEARGLPEVMVQNLLSNRRCVLKTVVPGFEFLGDVLSGGSLSVPMPPAELVLPGWYQELRRNHEANEHWPTDLGFELADWVDRQSLPVRIRRLSNTDYSHAVTYLPIFMAHVTAGKVTMEALPGHPSAVKFALRKVSDFDRQGWYLSAHSLMVAQLLRT